MDKFVKLTGVAAPLPVVNIDTDMIIPKDYLKTIKRTGLGKGLFAEARYNEDGSENADFVLNKPAYRSGADPRCWRQFRLRFIARARARGLCSTTASAAIGPIWKTCRRTSGCGIHSGVLVRLARKIGW